MLKIREAQMETLERARNAPFIERLTRDLEEGFPEECTRLGPAKVREGIEAGIRKAAGYGLARQCDVASFIVLLFGLGPDFPEAHEYAEARRFLADTSMPPGERLDRAMLRL